MKLFLLFSFCALQVLNSASKIIPDYLPQPCSKSQPDYSECTFKVMRKLGPYLLKGVEELNIPKMNPLIVPLFTVNRTLEDIATYSIILKNAQFWGLDATILKSFKFDTQKMNGDVHMNIDHMRMSTEYEANGRSLRYPFVMSTGGYCKGNFTNLDVFIKFGLKKTKKQGQTYYAFKDFKVTGTMEDGHIQIISKYLEDQPIADFMANFFNNNPKRALAIVQEDYDESVGRYFKYVAEQILNAVPAEELIPE